MRLLPDNALNGFIGKGAEAFLIGAAESAPRLPQP
jgi:hypothetical protein